MTGSDHSQIHDFKTLFVGVRPARVAVLINAEDESWKDTCLRVIECLSTVWGGDYSIIVPTDGNAISERFWALLEAFDPDYIFKYHKTLEDLRFSNPNQFNVLVESHVQQFARQTSSPVEDHARRQIEESLSETRTDRFEISKGLQDELKFRLAPLYFEQHIIQGHLYANSPPGHQLTAIDRVIPYCEHPVQLVDLQSSLSEIPELCLGSVAGRVSAARKKTLLAEGRSFMEEKYGEDRLTEIFDILVAGNAPSSSPFALSMSNLAYFMPVRSQAWNQPLVVVVGDTFRDFCLYQNLSRVRFGVSWLLPSWIAAFEAGKLRKEKGGPSLSRVELLPFYFSHSLLNSARSRVADRKLVFVSESLSRDAIARHVFLLNEALLMGHDQIEGRSEVRESIDELLTHPKVVYERDNAAKPRTQQFVDNLVAGFLETPKPVHFTELIPADHRWMTELAVKNQSYPRHPALGELMVRGTQLSTLEARSGKNGIAYFCPNSAIFGSDIDSILVKPTLFLPNTFEIMQRLAQTSGLHCDLSDKGYFLAETIRKFGSLRELGLFLRNERRRLTFNKYLDQTSPARGVRDEGVFLRSDRRRYLNFESFEKILGAGEEVKKLLDQLVPQSILYRGLIFKCEFCRNSDWFSIDEITHEFTCKRCSRKQVMASHHWREPEEPAWYYKLDEIVYQAHSNNMVVTAITLNFLEHQKTDSFMYTTDLEFSETPDGPPTQEIDICCVVDGRLCIGEAKKEDRLGTNSTEDARIAGRYLALAKRLGVRDVIFATAAPEWSARTKREIDGVFSGPPIRVRILERAELFEGLGAEGTGGQGHKS